MSPPARSSHMQRDLRELMAFVGEAFERVEVAR